MWLCALQHHVAVALNRQPKPGLSDMDLVSLAAEDKFLVRLHKFTRCVFWLLRKCLRPAQTTTARRDWDTSNGRWQHRKNKVNHPGNHNLYLARLALPGVYVFVPLRWASHDRCQSDDRIGSRDGSEIQSSFRYNEEIGAPASSFRIDGKAVAQTRIRSEERLRTP